MYIQKVVIENMKGLGSGGNRFEIDLTRPDGSFAGWTVLAGRNGSGKSTILKAIALSLSGLTVARRLQDSFAGWVREGEKEASVRTRIQPEDGDIFHGASHTRSKMFWSGLKFKCNGSDLEPSLEPFLDEDDADQTFVEKGPWADNPSGWFVAGYGPFRRMSGHAADARRLMSGKSHTGRLVSLFREDSSLFESLEWLKDIHTRALENRPGARKLKKRILALLDDGVLQDGMKVIDYDSEGLRVEQNGVKLTLEDLSDGYRTMASFILDLARQLYACHDGFPSTIDDAGPRRIDLPGVVLIDEIDIHLHVSWQQKIGYWLKSRFPKIQFIVTTHSPFICQAADKRGLIRLPGPGETGRADHISEALYYTIINGGVDDATMTDLFGLDFTHSESSERLRDEIAALEVKILHGKGEPSDRRRLRDLVEKLPRTTTSSIERSLRKLEIK